MNLFQLCLWISLRRNLNLQWYRQVPVFPLRTLLHTVDSNVFFQFSFITMATTPTIYVGITCCMHLAKSLLLCGNPYYHSNWGCGEWHCDRGSGWRKILLQWDIIHICTCVLTEMEKIHKTDVIILMTE